ncbi:hypothetical protein FRC07_010949, partial [Ceratobasidium sp. 392]
MIRLPALEYNLGHPHPKGQLFLLLTVILFLLALPVLVLVNLVTLGSELVPSLQSRFQPNDTHLENWWGPRRLPRLLRPRAPLCEPQSLGRGDKFRLSASLFDYTVMSTWNTTEGTPADGVQEQKRVEYRGQSFANCYVNNTRFDFNVIDQSQTVTVGVTCPGSVDYPIFVSLETSMTFAQQTSKDFIGQYYGPGLDLMKITDAKPDDYRKVVFAALEVISSDSLTIMLGQHLTTPALGMSYFLYTRPNTGGMYPPVEGSGTITDVRGTPGAWTQEANIYGITIANLLSVVNDAVNLDLGSNNYPNIFRDPSALSKAIKPNQPPQGINASAWAGGPDTQSVYYGQITPPYQTWAEMLLNGLPVKLGSVTGLPDESAMVTTYLCPIYQVKPTSALLTSVFVGSATMTLSVWGAWMLFTTFIAKKIMPP